MRGHFTPGAPELEWCERRLLARIHRYTVNRLRQEIEPVATRDFMRFLFDWQRVAPEARVEGADAVAGIVSQLEGFEAPAAAWETEILPARVNDYDPAWLDDLSRAGRVVWTRIAPLQPSLAKTGSRSPSPVRTTPITLASRRHLAALGRARAGRCRHRLDFERTARVRLSQRARCVVLRRDRRRLEAAACAGRRRARRAGGAGPGQLRQLRRPARAARAVGSAPRQRRPQTPAAHRAVRHRGRGPLGLGAKPPAHIARACRGRSNGSNGGGSGAGVVRRRVRSSSTSRARCSSATGWCSGA